MVRIKLSALFLASSMMGGCATTNIDPYTCMKNTKTIINPTGILLHIGGKSADVFSGECDEAKSVAMATLVARNADGSLNPVSAYVGKSFVDALEKDIKDTKDLNKAETAKQTLELYNKFLGDYGITYNDVLKALEPEPVSKPFENKYCQSNSTLIMTCK